MPTLTIGQLAKRVGLRTSALRYYEEQELLAPVGRTESGYRLYAPEAEQVLHFIQRAQRLGFSLADIRILLQGQQDGGLSDETAMRIAQDRYLELERQVTRLLVLQHELELFLRDIATSPADVPPVPLFDRLLDHICTDPSIQPAETMLDWLMTYTNCNLTTAEGQRLVKSLRGQHVHVWQKEDDYHILVVSDDPAIATALEEIAQLEAGCQAHAHTHRVPELMHNNEGYLLIARGDNAFIFARLFLALEKEEKL
ncbi:MAG: MerR family transcriptional regulator [Chloroflexi bacterium]|nr:MerR family transcriptional regulator [Chloroflexota bacterium]